MSKEDNKEEAPEQEQSIWRSLGGTLLYLLVIVLLTWVIVTFVGQRTKVDGHSMEPTLSDGDNLIVDKLSYRFRDPERYDIIVFPYQHAENTYYIKRIIGLPGETVQVIDGYMVTIAAAVGGFGSSPKSAASFCTASWLLRLNSFATRSITSPLAPQPKQKK